MIVKALEILKLCDLLAKNWGEHKNDENMVAATYLHYCFLGDF